MVDTIAWRSEGALHEIDPVYSCIRLEPPKLTDRFSRPFDALETRFRWPGYFGDLITMVAEQPARG